MAYCSLATTGAKIIDYLEEKNIPALVAWAHEPKALRLPSVGFDNFAAMSALTKYIMNLGHINIGMISGWTKSNDRARARVMAVRHIMSKLGLNAGNLKLIETDYGIETGAVAFNQIMQSPRAPTVIICGNDVLAAGALKQAEKIGISVPNTVSITGFDDIELACLVTPELSTVHVPHREMGRKAAEILVKMTKGLKVDATTELQIRIKVRGSLRNPKL